MIPKLKLITYNENFDDTQFVEQEKKMQQECIERKKTKLGKNGSRYLWANIYTSKDNLKKENK